MAPRICTPCGRPFNGETALTWHICKWMGCLPPAPSHAALTSAMSCPACLSDVLPWTSTCVILVVGGDTCGVFIHPDTLASHPDPFLRQMWIHTRCFAFWYLPLPSMPWLCRSRARHIGMGEIPAIIIYVHGQQKHTIAQHPECIHYSGWADTFVHAQQ